MISIRTFILLSGLLLIVAGCGDSNERVAAPPETSGETYSVSANGSPPIACWDFDEGSGTVLHDGCDGRDGNIGGATWSTGWCRSALEFDGTNDCVVVPGTSWLTLSKGTVETWVWIDPAHTRGRIISTEAPGWHNGLHMNWGTQLGDDSYINGGIYGGIHSTEGGNHYVEAYIDNVSKGEWHFVAFVWDGDANTLLVFVDGQTSTVTSPHPGIQYTGEPLAIGCYTEGGTPTGAWLKGSVDELKIYDRALSVEELNQHYAETCGTMVSMDIKPGSCPNPINPTSKGKFPVTILGSADFDANNIDVSSLLLEGVAPVRSAIEDVSAPAGGEGCDCAEEGLDGYDDLTLKFNTQEIAAAIAPVAKGDEKALRITGTLLDGTAIEASDCVVVVGGRADFVDQCGVDWTKSQSNPLVTGGFSGGTFDARDVRSLSVLHDQDQGLYKMWYSGLDNSSPPRERIGYATSPDGLTWTSYGPDPVIDLGPSGAFDEWNAYFPVVIKDDVAYKMWYTGDSYGRHYLGLATSPDGIHWTKYAGSEYGGSIVDWKAEGRSRYTQGTSVIMDDDLYKMWFGALEGSGGIGYATSSDGINWTIVGQVMPVGASGTFEEWRIHWPSVVKTGSQYLMLYAGQATNELRRFGLATSPDGVNWTRYAGNPVLPLGEAGEMDDFSHYYPHLMFESGILKLWFSGYGVDKKIGYAEANCQRHGSERWENGLTRH